MLFAHKLSNLDQFASDQLAPRRTNMSVTIFPRTGFVRLSSILALVGPIPVSKSTWWQGVRDGRFPKPQKLGPRTTVWKAEDILALFEGKDRG